jgi:hypothetical protein
MYEIMDKVNGLWCPSKIYHQDQETARHDIARHVAGLHGQAVWNPPDGTPGHVAEAVAIFPYTGDFIHFAIREMKP